MKLLEMGGDATMDALTQPAQASKQEYKKPKSGTGKKKATDAPSWAKGNKPYVGENGNDFAKKTL